MLSRILLDPQGGEGNGTDPHPAPPPADPKGTPDLARAIESLLAKHGQNGALEKLLNETHDLRDRLRELKGRVPKEGATVLEGDDARRWGDYRAIGDPDALRAALAERDTFKAEAASLRKAELLADAANLHGFKPGVLKTLARDLDLEIREEKGKDGKPVKVAVVKGEGDQSTPLPEYAEARWADFLPSLKADAAARPGSPRPAATPPVPPVAPAPAEAPRPWRATV